MPSWFSRMRNLIWTSILAVVAGSISAASAVFGAGIEVTAGFGALGLILAVISPKT